MQNVTKLEDVAGVEKNIGNRRQSENTQDQVPLPLDLLNPKSTDCDKVSSTITVPIFKSFRSWVFVLSC